MDRRITMVGVAAAVIAGACGHDGPLPDLDDFRSRADRTRARTTEAVERARRWVSHEAEDPGWTGDFDVRALRFAGRVGDAVHRPAADGAKGPGGQRTTLRQWAPESETSFELTEDRPVEIAWAPLAAADVGAIAVRAAADDGAFVRLRVVLGNGRSGGLSAVRIDLVADGGIREYVVDLRGALDDAEGVSLDRCAVSLETGRVARVASVELLRPDWKYDRAWGVQTERVGGETRSGVYLSGGGSLSLPLSKSWRDARLTFGLAEVVRGRSSRVTVDIDGSRGRHRLFDEKVVGGDPWRDVALELGAVDLDGATLVFSVLPDGGASVDGVVVWASPVLWEPPPEKLNIVVVLEDALRASRMSTSGHDRETTPFKTRFFADGVRFSRCVSQSTKTRFSCPSFMTSLRPLATGVFGTWNRNPRLAAGYVTLPEVLSGCGWATGSFLQNSNAGPDNGLGQGFDRVVENIPGRADRVYGGDALEWIEANRERNFFAYLHVADPHAPYDPPPSARHWFEEMIAASGGPRWEDPLWVRDARRALYDGEVANNDAALPALVEHLEALGLLDRTAIVMISDHGEHLGEHGLWDHVPPSYLQVIHVPFLVRLPPGWARPGVVDEPVQLLDLMPTLLDLAGIDAGRLPVQGRSLMPIIRGKADGLESEVSVVQEAMRYARPDDPKNVGSLVWGRWHFLDSDKVPTAFFDVVGDPEEERPVRVRGGLETEASALLADLRLMDDEIRRTIGDEGSAAVTVDADNLENLAALGYLDD